MALGITPIQAYGGTRILETNQSKNGQCTGTIIDPTGESVIGATVTVKGKQGGTITDLDGKFVLSDVQQLLSSPCSSPDACSYGRVQ